MKVLLKRKVCESHEQCMEPTRKAEEKKKKTVKHWTQSQSHALSKRSLSEDFPLHIIREGGTET